VSGAIFEGIKCDSIYWNKKSGALSAMSGMWDCLHGMQIPIYLFEVF
jgi:hypothetical protein